MSDERASPRLQVVGDLALVIDEEVPRLAEGFNELQRVSFGDFVAEVCDHATDQAVLLAGAFGGELAQIIEHSCFLFGWAGWRLNLGF